MKRLLTTVAAIALLTTTAHAGAKTTNLINSGLWAVDIIELDGRPMCSMTNTKVWPNGAYGLAQFKYENGRLFTHLTKSNWRIASGTQIPMTMTFDSGGYPGSGTVIDDQRGGSTIEIGVDANMEAGILGDFANAKQLSFSFDSGTETPWVTPMGGSRKAVAMFVKCIDWIKRNGPTQPGPDARTQPAPSQPAPASSRKKDDGSV